jgi:hypothetical protein
MMHSRQTIGTTTSWLAAFALVALAGCGGGGGDSQQPSAPATGANSAPTIQGAPRSSVVAGQAYSFQPAAADADGDTLTFTASNLPAWANFDQSTGRISGTPAAADVATYSSIRVTVSDGTASASTAMFSITVTSVGSASVTLSWTPPTQNEDGTTLTNLAGYEVRYGQDEDNLDQAVQLSNASLNRYVVENLVTGTWFFAVLAVNGAGSSSVLSSVVSKTI